MRNHTFSRRPRALGILCTVMFMIPCTYWLLDIICNSRFSVLGNNVVTLGRQDSLKTSLEYPASPPPTVSKRAATHIRRTEEVRLRFQKKRERLLIGTRNIYDIGLYEARDGSTIIWNYFPPTFTCPHLMERVGTPGDGGKWMCGLETFESNRADATNKDSDCIVYSFGVARESSYETEILERTNCKIWAFDPTVQGLNFKYLPETLKLDAQKRTKFSPIGLGGVSQAKKNIATSTLKDIMTKYNHSWIDFLKVDIEGAEFESFLQISRDFPYSFPFGHLNMEIHLQSEQKWSPVNLFSTTKGKLAEFYRFWTVLEERGLRAFSWEDNHNPCVSGRQPNLMEYSFFNIKDKRNKLLRF